MNILLFLAGLAALVAGSSLLVRGASKLALSFGISPLVVGLTIVAFGTSAPEVAVSVGAVLDGKTDIAIGNVVGSNIFNVLFILGISALITPLVVNIQLIRQEVPIMLGLRCCCWSSGWTARSSLLDGALLFGLMLAYTVFLVVQSRKRNQGGQAEMTGEFEAARPGAWDAQLPAQIALIAAGLALLVFGSEWLVTAVGGVCQGDGRERPDHRPDHRRRRHLDARSSHLDRGGHQGRARHRRGQRDRQQHLQHPGLPGFVQPGFGQPGPRGAGLGDGLRYLGHAGRGAGLPADLPDRARDRTLGGRGSFSVTTSRMSPTWCSPLSATRRWRAFSSAMMSFVVPLTVITVVVALIRRPEHQAVTTACSMKKAPEAASFRVPRWVSAAAAAPAPQSFCACMKSSKRLR